MQSIPPVELQLKFDAHVIRSLTPWSKSAAKCPLFSTKAAAGFPSPAEDYIQDKLSLDDMIIKHPAATYFIRVSGNSMVNEGIRHNDILVVDRSITPQDGKIAVVAIDGEITVKKLRITQGKMYLMPANSQYAPIEVKEENEVRIWGVVITVIHNF